MIDIDVHTLRDRTGQELGAGVWFAVTQERIQQVADATGDHQWIHLDTARAARESPYETTIAHGFLTLSLISTLLRETLKITGVRMAINYGVNRVRFIAAVPSGARIRGRFTLTTVQSLEDSIQVTWSVTVEREGGEKPCLVAEWLVRYYPADTASVPSR
jgi:acyl dehydratase